MAAVMALLAAGLYALLPRDGWSAKGEPSALEAWLARQARRLAMPRSARSASNPVPESPEALARARAHFADHCAGCHGNDGKGQTAIGRNLYPKAPDMTAPPTQSLSDGELFFVIDNGVRLTGMPAFPAETPAAATETWELVHFIRHLPRLSEAEQSEMREQNPKSKQELEQEQAIRRFLEGGK